MNTHESMKSKSSPPSSGTKDSPAIVLGAEALEEGPFQRIFAFVSISAVLGLGGFGGRGNRNMWNGPSLWERRARNKKSMILKRQTTRKLQGEQ
jgi:hypothetical protein